MKKIELEKDVEFLAKRQLQAGSFSFSDTERDYGMSSNSIVSIAYGLSELKDQLLPSDISDMASCERMWEKLPEHRKREAAWVAMQNARNCDYYGKK